MVKVALYPLDRFTEGLIKFRDLLNLEIKNVIDFSYDGECDVEITSSVQAGLSDVEVLIVSTLSQEFVELKQILQLASEKGIKIISINEAIDEQTDNWLRDNNITVNTFAEESSAQFTAYMELLQKLQSGALPEIDPNNKPALKKIGIFGTGEGNEQFVAQMSLMRVLLKDGKKVTAMIAEPTSFLFGQPDISLNRFSMLRPPLEFPGYTAVIEEKAINDNCDYLIMADQGNAAYGGDILSIICKMVFWIGMEFNEFMLTVGYDDDETITDCLDLLRIYGRCPKPLALLLSDREDKTQEEIASRKKTLQDKFGIENVELISDIKKIASKL